MPGARWRHTEPDLSELTGAYAAGGGVVVAELRNNDVSRPNRLVAVDGATGEFRWRFDLALPGDPLLAPPVIAGDRLLVVDRQADGTGTLHALSLPTGEVAWERADVGVYGVALAAAGRTVAVSGSRLDTGRLSFLDAASGAEVGGADLSSTDRVALAGEGGRIVALARDGRLSAFAGDDPGRPVWSIDPGPGERAAVDLRGGVVLARSATMTETFALASGARLATIDGVPSGDGFIAGDGVARVDLATGAQRWRVAAAQLGATEILRVSAETAGSLAVLTDTGAATLVAATGEVRSRARYPGHGFAAREVWTTGTVTYYSQERPHIAANAEWALTAVDAATGKQLWRVTSHRRDFQSTLVDGRLLTGQGNTLLQLG